MGFAFKFRHAAKGPRQTFEAPWSQTLTDYDERHLVTYLRLLDADQEGADWREAARLVLGRDPGQAPELSRRCWETHMARARWMTQAGYRDLLAASGD